jgi:glucokinase
VPSLTLGLDLGGSTLKVAWIREGAVIASGVVPNLGQPTDLDAAAQLADELRPDGDQILVGIAVPGVVDTARSRLVSAHGKYAHLQGVDLATWSLRRFGVRAVVENDARAALLGELAHGVAAGVRDAVLLVAGTGIGTAAVIDGQLVRGRSGHAGILGGHLTIDRGGEPCNCGNVGCAEVYGGSWSLPAGITMADVFASAEDPVSSSAARTQGGAAAAEGPGLAARVLQSWAITAVNLCHAYDPSVVILSGGAVELAGSRVQEIERYLHRHLWSSVPRPTVVVADDPARSVVRGLAATTSSTAEDTR